MESAHVVTTGKAWGIDLLSLLDLSQLRCWDIKIEPASLMESMFRISKWGIGRDELSNISIACSWITNKEWLQNAQIQHIHIQLHVKFVFWYPSTASQISHLPIICISRVQRASVKNEKPSFYYWSEGFALIGVSQKRTRIFLSHIFLRAWHQARVMCL
jgi:hypothetical protein